MVLGQSAATAAVHAIQQKTTVQGIDYAKLKIQLLADRQVLDFIPPPRPASANLPPPLQLDGIVVDQKAAVLSGFEALSQAAHPFHGEDYAHDDNQAKGQQSAVFTATLPADGKYTVRLAYTALPNRASNVPVTVGTASGPVKVVVNQRLSPSVKGLLHPLGTWNLKAGANTVEISNAGTDGHVIIDAVQWLKQD
jgi:hypothetical protein